MLSQKFDVDIQETDFDRYQIQNSGSLTPENYLHEGLISDLDYSFISEFKKDVDLHDYDIAIQNIEKRILTSSLSNENFNRYTLLLNTLLIAGDYYSSKSDTKASINQRSNGGSVARLALSKESAACAVSVAANAVSTYGLTSCFVPGPNCWAAAAGKALSLAGIYLSC